MCDVEYGIKGLLDNNKDTIRQDYAVILRKAKPPKHNISKDESEALKSLNRNPYIIVLKADKGGVVVILYKEDYRKKIMDHLINSEAT